MVADHELGEAGLLAFRNTSCEEARAEESKTSANRKKKGGEREDQPADSGPSKTLTSILTGGPVLPGDGR